MRKIIVSFIIIISTLLFTSNINAYVGNGFIWNKSEISIPINSNFESYLSEFEVKFYYNDHLTSKEVKVKLDNFYYGNLSISTNKVETKTVYLLATVENYTNYDRKQIIVHVVDDVIPDIKVCKELVFEAKKTINISDYFLVTDNDKIKNVDYDISKLNLDLCGKYEILVTAYDLSSNKNQRKFECMVIDYNKPIISLASFIEVGYGEEFEVSKYAKAFDEYDGDLTNSISVEGLDIFKLGEQTATFKVMDLANNQTTLTKLVKVVDNEAPNLELKKYNDTIYIDDKEKVDFRKYIDVVSDNVDKLDVSDVEIDLSDYSYELGESNVYFILKDKSNNYCKRVLKINKSYKSKPTISITNPEIKVGDTINLKDYIEVSDLYDKYVENQLQIDESVIDYNKPGTYEVIVEAMNFAGNESKEKMLVHVKESESDKYTSTMWDFLYKYKFLIAIGIMVTSFFIIYKIRKNKVKLGE